MIHRHDDGRGNEHPPITIEGENHKRAEDMKMRFDPAAGQSDQQSRHQRLRDGDHVARGKRTGPDASHPNGKNANGAAQKDGRPNMNVDLTRLPGPC